MAHKLAVQRDHQFDRALIGHGANAGDNRSCAGPGEEATEADPAGIGHPTVAAGQHDEAGSLGGLSKLVARHRPVAQPDRRQQWVVAPEDAVCGDMYDIGAPHCGFGASYARFIAF